MIQVIPKETFDRWRKLWIFTTLAWFLSGNIWIYVALMAVVLSSLRKKEHQVFSLYLLLLFAAPNSYVPVPGFGVIDHLIMLDHYRLLALILLLPTAWHLMKDNNSPKFGSSPVDLMITGYLMLSWIMNLPETSVTNGLRIGVLKFIDGFLPYYVASRSIRSIAGFRSVMISLLISAVLISVLAVFEVLRSWKLYLASIAEYGLAVGQNYKMRGPFLRPAASVQDSIIVGLVVVVGMCAMLYLKERFSGKLKVRVLWLFLACGLLASLSRAPWVAGFLLLFIFYIQEKNGVVSLLKVHLVLALGLLALSLFPVGKFLIDLLPFVGEAEQGSVDYRVNWLSTSLPLIERNFWFGDVHVRNAPELEVMRNGEGIIDLVNMFLAVLLHYGVVGFSLFLGMFFVALRRLKKAERVLRITSIELSRLGRALMAVVVSIMFVMFTLSEISVAPIVIWTFMGFCSAYGFLIDFGKKAHIDMPHLLNRSSGQ